MMSPLATVLVERAISQSELMRRTGLARQTVVDAFHSRGDVSLSTWVRIAKALGVPLISIAPQAAEELRGLVVA